MSFFQQADELLSQGGLFEGVTEGDMLMLGHAFEQQMSLRRDANNNPTRLKMRKDAERSFRANYDVEMCFRGSVLPWTCDACRTLILKSSTPCVLPWKFCFGYYFHGSLRVKAASI